MEGLDPGSELSGITEPANTNASTSEHSFGPSRRWRASIDLGFSLRAEKTVMSEMAFKGTLRVQRPFYPEGNICHIYLLHPPGGMVSGDRIEINVNVESGAHALITTPSAGKIYQSDSADGAQCQDLNLTVDQGVLEWLPQENILFDGAHARLRTRITLGQDAQIVFWDMVGLGRQAGDLPFRTGKLQQSLQLWRNDVPLLLESFELDPELELLSSQAGLMGFTQFGTMLLTCAQNHEQDIVETLRDLDIETDSAELLLAVSSKPGVVLVRVMAHCAERMRNAMINCWTVSRAKIHGIPAVAPRIWST